MDGRLSAQEEEVFTVCIFHVHIQVFFWFQKQNLEKNEKNKKKMFTMCIFHVHVDMWSLGQQAIFENEKFVHLFPVFPQIWKVSYPFITFYHMGRWDVFMLTKSTLL